MSLIYISKISKKVISVLKDEWNNQYGQTMPDQIYRVSYICAHVLLNLLNNLGKRDTMWCWPSILSLCPYCTEGQNIFMGESSKFQKSWTFKIQILKLVVCLQNVNNFKLKWSIAKRWTKNKFRESIKICLIQHFEADFLWKARFKILNSGIILKTFTHAYYRCRPSGNSNTCSVLLLLCLFNSLRTSQQFFSYIGTGLHGLNQC